jgi:hypothetical protein
MALNQFQAVVCCGALEKASEYGFQTTSMKGLQGGQSTILITTLFASCFRINLFLQEDVRVVIGC